MGRAIYKIEDRIRKIIYGYVYARSYREAKEKQKAKIASYTSQITNKNEHVFSYIASELQILLERYAYSEIGGTFILIWRYAFSTQNGTFFLYYCDVTIIHHSAKEELLCTTTILFLES